MSDCVVRLLDSVTCRWNPGEPNGSNGHRALTDSYKFAAELLPLNSGHPQTKDQLSLRAISASSAAPLLRDAPNTNPSIDHINVVIPLTTTPQLVRFGFQDWLCSDSNESR